MPIYSSKHFPTFISTKTSVCGVIGRERKVIHCCPLKMAFLNNPSTLAVSHWSCVSPMWMGVSHDTCVGADAAIAPSLWALPGDSTTWASVWVAGRSKSTVAPMGDGIGDAWAEESGGMDTTSESSGQMFRNSETFVHRAIRLCTLHMWPTVWELGFHPKFLGIQEQLGEMNTQSRLGRLHQPCDPRVSLAR